MSDEWETKTRKLAKEQFLSLSESELGCFAQELPRILEWFSELDKVQVSSDWSDLETVRKTSIEELRDDEPKPSRLSLLDHSKTKQARLIVGPKTVLEEEQ